MKSKRDAKPGEPCDHRLHSVQCGGMNLTATVTKMTRSFSQRKFDRFVAQQIKSMARLRAKGHRDWKSATDEQIRNVAEYMARVYNAGEVLTS